MALLRKHLEDSKENELFENLLAFRLVEAQLGRLRHLSLKHVGTGSVVWNAILQYERHFRELTAELVAGRHSFDERGELAYALGEGLCLQNAHDLAEVHRLDDSASLVYVGNEVFSEDVLLGASILSGSRL